VNWFAVENYPRPIPDAALLRLSEAQKSGLFHGFYIVEPSYGSVGADPWLIGFIRPDHYIVLAYWE